MSDDGEIEDLFGAFQEGEEEEEEEEEKKKEQKTTASRTTYASNNVEEKVTKKDDETTTTKNTTNDEKTKKNVEAKETNETKKEKETKDDDAKDEEGKDDDDDDDDDDNGDVDMEDLTKSPPEEKKEEKEEEPRPKTTMSALEILALPTFAASERVRKAVAAADASSNTAAGGTTTPTAAEDPNRKPSTAVREIATGTSHDKSVRSYTAFPEHGYQQENKGSSGTADDADAAAPRSPAKTYPFTLDPFQQRAVDYVEKGESVLVAAHTSAGKTAVAEYAVAKSLRDGQRVVYTSPIKALSNQKYRDLQEEFEDVGLMTGDVTINASATCLVMTTEILRSMLYRGSEIVREVAWVIYDEVHYMRDKERGVVWEESIVLLPHRVRFVFLSATIPNAEQFARWIAKTHRQPCHVVYTNYRPVPLQHYVFPSGGDGLHLVVDEKGVFRERNFAAAMATLRGEGEGDESGGGGGGGGRGPNKRRRGNNGGRGGKQDGATGDLFRIVRLIMDRNLNPVIVFSFSKKDCERYALELHREDYTDDMEKDLITQVYSNAIDSLGEDDQRLPQVQALLPLLKRGIGIHHGGLLPILKEIVEILFSEGLVKALFATETFAIGINMPAKTVVFTNCRKWDGKDFRWVTSGEYIQMSGRAGRRGKDDRGIVVQMLDERMDPDACKAILYGDPDPLNSSYRISYNMLLNMMRVDGVDPEYLLHASFHQFQQESAAPALEARAAELEARAAAIPVAATDGARNEEAVAEYYHMDEQLEITKRKLSRIVRRPEYLLPYLNAPGRLLDVTVDGVPYGWGALVAHRRKAGVDSAGEAGRVARATAAPDHALDVLLRCVDRRFDRRDEDDDDDGADDADSGGGSGLLWRGTIEQCRPVARPHDLASEDEPREEMRLFTVTLDDVERVSAVRIFLPKDRLSEPRQRRAVGRAVAEVGRRLKGVVPVLDPVKDLRVGGVPEFAALVNRAAVLAERLAAHPVSPDDAAAALAAYGRRRALTEEARALRREARACQTMVMKDDLRRMKRVLRKLGHVDAAGVIQTKGRTACEINTADELVMVELVFAGVFNDLTVEQCVALLSCLTYDERVKDADEEGPRLKSFLANPLAKLKDAVRTVARASAACRVEVDEEELVKNLNPGMMEAVFAWCKGARFVEVQRLTGSFEGTTIRTLRRIEELVRQVTSAARAIGNHELQTKFETGSELLKRDIVFCSSLYL